MNLKLKVEFENKVVERRNPLTGNVIRADFREIEVTKYHQYYKSGFQDVFEIEEIKESEKVPVTQIENKPKKTRTKKTK